MSTSYTIGLDLQVNVNPSIDFNWLIDSQNLAQGYGVAEGYIRKLRFSKKELKEGVHYLTLPRKLDVKKLAYTSLSETLTADTTHKSALLLVTRDSQPSKKQLTAQTSKTYFTKAGVVRIGFFINSPRAIHFRQWAENLILKTTDASHAAKNNLLAKTERNHNRLNQSRLIDILQDVCLISDNELRERIVKKLLNK